MIRASVVAGTVAAVVIQGGCRTAEQSAAAPMAATATDESPWPYLVAKYDRNGDGRVERAEYDRGETAFDRLDRDDDGAISAADFARDGRGMAAMRRGMMGQTTVAGFFQDDDDAAELTLDELKRSIGAYDTDGDGSVSEGEFRASADDRYRAQEGSQMMARMMGDVDAWDALADAVDADDDDLVSGAELVAFFKSRDSDGNDVWALNRGRGGRGGGAPPREEEMSGPKVGTMAPDFTLRPPDGGAPVRLSSFREKNVPVALIFGSYT